MVYVSDPKNVSRLMADQNLSRDTAIAQDALENSNEIGDVRVVDESGRLLMIITIDPKFGRERRGENA